MRNDEKKVSFASDDMPLPPPRENVVVVSPNDVSYHAIYLPIYHCSLLNLICGHSLYNIRHYHLGNTCVCRARFLRHFIIENILLFYVLITKMISDTSAETDLSRLYRV